MSNKSKTGKAKVLEVYCDGEDRITRTDENEYRSKVVVLSAAFVSLGVQEPSQR